MERPPGTPPLEAFGSSVCGLFEQAFSANGAATSRPDAKAWATGLGDLKAKLRACTKASWHHFPNELQSCPWCVFESQTGVRLFGTRIVPVSATGMVDVGKLWAAITAVPVPDPDPPLPSERAWKLPTDAEIPDRKVKLLRQAFCMAAILIGFAGCIAMRGGGGVFGLIALVIGLVVYPWVSPRRRSEAQREVATARAAYEGLLDRWNREALVAPFRAHYYQLEMAKANLADVPNERKRRLAKLEAEREKNQRIRFLDSYPIDRAGIRNIGASRTAMLASYGIETAADVLSHAILQIPGFGPAYTKSLVDWRNRIEARFQFNPREPIDPQQLQTLEQDLASRTQELVVMLRQGPTSLHAIGQHIIAGRQRLGALLQKSWLDLKVAEARQAAM
jgi:DNA-binding helix-hairpin-helix protein with protein kinase domain